MPENCHITTIEKYEKRIPIAKQNFKTTGREDKITLLEGDAAEILAELSQPFDFIFMDAAKGQYIKSCVTASTMGPGVKINAQKQL